MTEYPFAIEMELADRNLKEIILSERLAEETLDVIQHTSRTLLSLLDVMHKAGAVHGDFKPNNIVRVDREFKLIDLDMAITVGSTETVPHANA